MAFPQSPGNRVLAVLVALAGILIGCSLGRAPGSPEVLQPPTDPPTVQGAVANSAEPQRNEQDAPPEVVAETSGPPIDPPPPSPLALAMARAGSHYDLGVQAMRSGDSDQAQWEFDAALETLVDTGLDSTITPRVITPDRIPPVATRSWFSPPLPLSRETAKDNAAADPDEPTQEAPALLSPEDAQAIETEPSEDAAGVPEPDIQKYEFPIVFNDQVKKALQYFQTQKWGVITRAFERARRYLPMMRAIFHEKGLPEELLNLAFIESAVNPWATSRVKAAGIWQFMAPTARLYGMQVSWWVDERRDPEKATRGAADYLGNLYQMFGSWELALAAYNAGEGKVQRTVDRQRTRDYWKLRLPKETRAFVPAFMAMAIISKEPERYGFSPPPDDPFEAVAVALDQPADFRTLAQVTGVPVEHLRELNPALIRGTTPPGVSRHHVRVPADVTPAFLEELARIPPDERVAWTTHRVRKGETSSSIARRYRTTLKTFLEMNGLKRRQALKPGSSVLVLAPAAAPALLTADAAVDRSRAPSGGAKPARHTVKKGETVAKIASAYGVSPDELRHANGLSRNASLRPGQQLRLPASAAEDQARAARKNLATAVAGPLSSRAAERRYTVKRGDTLFEIARAHGVSLEDLRRTNRLPPDAPLQIGQVLHIPESPS